MTELVMTLVVVKQRPEGEGDHGRDDDLQPGVTGKLAV